MSNSDDGWNIELKGVSDIGFSPIIKVIGVGGGGSNAVDYMFRQGIDMVDFIVCNTDIQALRSSHVTNRIQIGKMSTEGLGAGCRPERGSEAAEENMGDIRALLEQNTKVLFITAGMGGGTGTGAAPKIAKLSKELGILTIGIVSVPFEFEGKNKLVQAMKGIDEMEKYVDAISIIVNDRLLDDGNPVKLSEAFSIADSVLAMATKSIADIIMIPGYVNIDLSDVYKVLCGSGVTLIGSGDGSGENRALDAIESALLSPLLRDRDITGASDILLLIQYGSKELLISEHVAIMNYISTQTQTVADIIWGTSKDDSLGDDLRVAIVVTGFGKGKISSAHHGNIKNITPEPVSISGQDKGNLPPREEPVRTPDFKIEKKAEDLHLEMENTAEIEKEAREKKKKISGDFNFGKEDLGKGRSETGTDSDDAAKRISGRNMMEWLEKKFSSKGDDYTMS